MAYIVIETVIQRFINKFFMMMSIKDVCWLYALLCCIFSWNLCSTKELPEIQTLSKWNFMLESQLTHQLTAFTGVDVLRESYKDSGNVELIELNGHQLLSEAILKMEVVLEKKEEALKRLVTAAENAISQYKENPALSLEDVKFLNMKELKKNDDQLHYSAQFKQNVSFNESGVHIPLEIYEGYPQILNGLKWSSALNDVFKENLRLDPSIRWQYFGSQRGFMRVYPALR